ncbi:MAG: DUF2058 family protein [bacterium]|nr:DUF2058 family protein [bacterium]
MLDLKSKLLAAGLVTEEQINKINSHRSAKTKKLSSLKTTNNNLETRFIKQQREKHVNELSSVSKSERYEVVRRWVKHNRFDIIVGLPSENAQKYFFQKENKNISWLTLEPAVHALVVKGDAGIMAFMSNHGLDYCVLPKDIIEDVAKFFPEWLRVLKDHPLDTALKEETAR